MTLTLLVPCSGWNHSKSKNLHDHSRATVDETCWGEWLDIAGVPLIPLIRGIDQPFNPDTERAGT